MTARSRHCSNCTRVIAPRAGKTPRYCPICGYPFEYEPPRGTPPPPARMPAVRGTAPQTLGYSTVKRARSGKAVAALAFGVLGIFLCNLLGIVAIIQGSAARREIDASGGMLYGRGLATTGLVLGIISLAVMGFAALSMVAR